MRYTINGSEWCFLCGSTAHDPHEGYGGRNRQLSIKYGLVVALCRTCHRFVHNNPKSPQDLEIKELCRNKFESENPDLDFIEVFK